MKRYSFLIAIICGMCLSETYSQSVFSPAFYYSYEYHDLLERTLLQDRYDFFYMCVPSFSQESALSMCDSTLVYMYADEKPNIWYAKECRSGERAKKAKVKTKRYEMTIGKDQALILRNLFDAATRTANYFGEETGLDGVSYYLDYRGRKVETWMPDPLSCVGRTITVLDSLCYAVYNADLDVLQRQIIECRKLTGEYRQLYPADCYSPEVYKETVYYNKGKGKNITLLEIESGRRLSSRLTITSRLTIKYKANESDTLEIEKLAKTVIDSIGVWERELFINNIDKFVDVLVCDTIATRCEVETFKDNLTVIASQENLNRDVIFKACALQKGYYILSPTGDWQPVESEEFDWQPVFREFFSF